MCQCNPSIRTPWCRACKDKKFGIKEVTSMSVVSENGEVLMDLNIPPQKELNIEDLHKLKIRTPYGEFVVYVDDENMEEMKKISESTKFEALDS